MDPVGRHRGKRWLLAGALALMLAGAAVAVLLHAAVQAVLR